MATTISVPYTILMDDGIQESQEPGQPMARVRFKCLASDRYKLVADLMGTSAAAGSSGGGGTGPIIRVFPFQYPPSPNLICLAIESIEFRGPGYRIPGIGDQWVVRKYAYVTARFGLATFGMDGSTDPSGQPYTTTTFESIGENFTVPTGVYRFPSGATTNAPVSVMMPVMQITQVRHMLPFAPIAQKAFLYGKVNNSPVSFAGFAFPTGTLLFVGGPDTITSDTAGNVMYESTYVALYRPQPWNFAFSPVPGEGWALIIDPVTGLPPYVPASFVLP